MKRSATGPKLIRGLAQGRSPFHSPPMQVLIRCPDKPTEEKALAKLIPRNAGKSWSSGEIMVSSDALAFLAAEGVTFTVIGPAPYERITSLRDSRAVAV